MIKNKKYDKRQHLINRLEKVECPDTTFITNTFPTVLKKGTGHYVTDVNNKRYLDFTSGFGTLAFGHRSAITLNALRKQSGKLIQGLGDIHPTESKIKLLELIAKITPYNNPKILLAMNGGDAVEIAMKTAILATKRTKFLSFDGGYHGTQFAPLSLNHNKVFTEGFEEYLKHNKATALPFPYFEENGPKTEFENTQDPNFVLSLLENNLSSKKYAALILEPIQGRGGTRIFPKSFLLNTQNLCKKHGTLLIFDEIMTGFGRTGTLFGYEHSSVIPDLMCIGKGMGGGMPLSACVGDIMDVWKKSEGEARHTQTFLGHPLSCAVGYQTILHIIKMLPTFQKEALNIHKTLNNFVKICATENPCFVRGKGFMHALYFYKKPKDFGVFLSNELYKKGFLTLPEGKTGEVLALLPSLTITAKEYQILFKSLLRVNL